MIAAFHADFVSVETVAVILLGNKTSIKFIEDKNKAANLFLSESKLHFTEDFSEVLRFHEVFICVVCQSEQAIGSNPNFLYSFGEIVHHFYLPFEGVHRGLLFLPFLL